MVLTKRRLLLLGFGLLAAFVLGEWVYYLYLVRNRPAPVSSGSPKIEVARTVLGCLDEMRGEEELYLLNRTCADPANCQDGVIDKRAELYVLWGRSKYLEKTGDEQAKALLMKDIGLYLDEDKVKVIQPDLWGRNLLWQIWQNPYLSAEDKTKVEKLAQRTATGEGSWDLAAAMERFGNPDYQGPDISAIIAGPNTPSKDEFNGYDFETGLGFASDFLSYGLWRNDRRAQIIGKELFALELQRYKASPSAPTLHQHCLLGYTAADFYRLLKEDYYLNFAVSIWDQSEITSDCAIGGGCSINSFPAALCGMFAQALYEETQELKYQEAKNMILDKLIKVNFDAEGYPGRLTGDGCFYDPASAEKVRGIRENGLLVGLLSE